MIQSHERPQQVENTKGNNSKKLKHKPGKQKGKQKESGRPRQQVGPPREKSHRGTTGFFQPITQRDIDQIYERYFLPNIDHPEALQHKVFFDLMYYTANYIGKKHQWYLCNLRKDCFHVGVTPDGREFIQMLPEAQDEDWVIGSGISVHGKHAIMEQGGPRCPVASFKKYLSKLHPECKWFFQEPSVVTYMQDMWYRSSPLDALTLSNFMVEISKKAGLQTLYTTNGCIKNKYR